ncbi:hypothetical protein D3C72_2472750 [compost metagenome]
MVLIRVFNDINRSLNNADSAGLLPNFPQRCLLYRLPVLHLAFGQRHLAVTVDDQLDLQTGADPPVHNAAR